MRLSWVDPTLVAKTRESLASCSDATLFVPDFVCPEKPDGFPDEDWPRVAEHVARAERVSRVVRDQGLEASIREFGNSVHAIEVATVVAAAAQVNAVSFELLRSLLSCSIDDLIVYGEFLQLLSDSRHHEPDVTDLYEQFCAALLRAPSAHAQWGERVKGARLGLACHYLHVHRPADSDKLFAELAETHKADMSIFLTAGRAFLACGEIARSTQWLDRGAKRADKLGRAEMAQTLRSKSEKLRARGS